MHNEKVYFHDTTLRDGEQTPGLAFSEEVRTQIALQLDDLGVDIIELGFAASSKEQRTAMRHITRHGLRAKTLSLARPKCSDIDAALDAGVDGVILVMGFSDLHLRYKFNDTFAEALEMLEKGISYAKSQKLYVQVSAEDGTRTTNDNLKTVAGLAQNYHVDRICISDTVGCGTAELMKDKVACIKTACTIPVSVHCHNDFGLAVSNSIAAVQAGARNLAVTMNGLGERTGNASLEQCVMALTQLYDYTTNINMQKLTKVSQYIAKVTGIEPEPMHPIIGRNCFRHESGIHIDAILKNPKCYEPYDPEIVGRKRELTLGKTNGTSAIMYFTKRINESLNYMQCRQVLHEVQIEADQNKKINLCSFKEIVKHCKAAQ